MNRLVYLFELDSVRKYPNCHNSGVLMSDGVRGLLCEIIKRGNSVAITMNQLTDSQFIREAMADDAAYSSLLQLFELGALRVSLYDKIRTASQYIQNSIEKCLSSNEDGFVFSNLPVNNNEKELLQDIKNSLAYSDLSALQERMDNSDGAESERMQIIYRFVKMILNLSVSQTSNIPPKKDKKRGFEDFLEIILEILSKNVFLDAELDLKIKNAISIIKQRSAGISDGRSNRSNWLDVQAQEGSHDWVANQIIHICYNYTVEDSINGVSKHYDENDFKATFEKDLVNRVYMYCTDDKTTPLKTVSCRKWKTAVRFGEYMSDGKLYGQQECTQYERNFKVQKIRWLTFILKKNIWAMSIALLYIFIFCATEFGISIMENFFEIPIKSIWVSSLISAVLFGIVGALIDIVLRFVNRGKDIPNILESVEDIVIHIFDFIRAFGGNNDSYRLS